jgi:hypothetical protein
MCNTLTRVLRLVPLVVPLQSTAAWQTTERHFRYLLGHARVLQSKFIRDDFYQVSYFKEPNAFTRYTTMLKRYYGNFSTIGKRSLDTRQSDWKLDASYHDESDTKTKLAISGITCGDVVQRFQGSTEKFKTWLATYEKTSKYGSYIAISIIHQCAVWTVNAKEKTTGAFNNIKKPRLLSSSLIACTTRHLPLYWRRTQLLASLEIVCTSAPMSVLVSSIHFRVIII